jgi:sensor domain CHASE-containing protein
MILKNELDELLIEQDTVSSRKQKIQHGLLFIILLCLLLMFLSFSATDHLIQEKEKVQSKIRLLLEEQQLIDQHLQSQQKKLNELMLRFCDFCSSFRT